MTMQEPGFASFLNSFYDSAGRLITANTVADYIITPELLKGDNLLRTFSNALRAFEAPIGETLKMMEDDLRGDFLIGRKRKYAPQEPYIHDGKFHMRSLEFDRMIMVPLIMDFSDDGRKLEKLYCSHPVRDKLTPYAEAMIQGIRDYYTNTPDGLFEFYPFIGIDPRLHTMEFLEELLDKYVNTSGKMHQRNEVPEKPCYGIKIYPPLGFRPWPDDSETLEKHRKLYSFCQEKGVPIITHCDDQGFRGINAADAWAYTDPASWRTVLENYPGLRLDFAHFGKQYAIASKGNLQSLSAKLRHLPDSPWFYTIIELMEEFDGVYSDLSFSGCTNEFYSELLSFLSEQKDEKREKILSRILFGSDFSVNLLKVESYTEYFSVFDRSGFTDGEIERIAGENALSFLGLSEAPAKESRRRLPIRLPRL